MKKRFFYAAHSHNTWPKLFVLTEDGRFYCEYLDYMQPAKVIEQKDFNSFKAEDYQWNGYQSIVEISEEEAVRKPLTRQNNWVANYISKIN